MGADDIDALLNAKTLRLMADITVSRALYAAAALGIVDEIYAGARTVAQLARATGCLEEPLARLLRLLIAIGVVSKDHAGRLSVTDLGKPLAADAEASVRYDLMRNDEYLAWGELLYSLQTGRPAYEKLFGTSFYGAQEHSADAAAQFGRHMRQRTRAMFGGLFEQIAWERGGVVIDVGGGDGSVLAGILAGQDDLTGVVYDLELAEAGARRLLSERGLARRGSFVVGDATASVPAGGTTYLLVNVLHNWTDDAATAILANCAVWVAGGGRVIVCEFVVPENAAMHPSKASDLAMLVLFGGKERTQAAWRQLAERAGLRIDEVVTAPGAAGSALVCKAA